jgi:hypothetical protein
MEDKPTYFYCAQLSAKGDILMKQTRVARISQETCEHRCLTKKCPQGYRDPAGCPSYKEGVLYE